MHLISDPVVGPIAPGEEQPLQLNGTKLWIVAYIHLLDHNLYLLVS